MSEVRLGPFLVRTERTRVTAYRNAISGRGEDVPAAFPICWLALPEIRAAIGHACGERLPLHEGQTFEYLHPLEVDADYRLSVVLQEQADPPRLAVKGEIATIAGEPRLRMETLVRLVTPAALALSP